MRHFKFFAVMALTVGWLLIAGLAWSIVSNGVNVVQLGWPTFLFYAAVGVPLLYAWMIVATPVLFRIIKEKS